MTQTVNVMMILGCSGNRNWMLTATCLQSSQNNITENINKIVNVIFVKHKPTFWIVDSSPRMKCKIKWKLRVRHCLMTQWHSDSDTDQQLVAGWVSSWLRRGQHSSTREKDIFVARYSCQLCADAVMKWQILQLPYLSVMTNIPDSKLWDVVFKF